jgi:hypothetical protein
MILQALLSMRKKMYVDKKYFKYNISALLVLDAPVCV